MIDMYPQFKQIYHKYGTDIRREDLIDDGWIEYRSLGRYFYCKPTIEVDLNNDIEIESLIKYIKESVKEKYISIFPKCLAIIYIIVSILYTIKAVFNAEFNVDYLLNYITNSAILFSLGKLIDK